MPIVNTTDLNEAYDAYKADKIMRKELFRIVIDKVLEMDSRLVGMEESASARQQMQEGIVARIERLNDRLSSLGDEIDTKVATAANTAFSMFRTMNGDGTSFPANPNIAYRADGKPADWVDVNPSKRPYNRKLKAAEAEGKANG